MFSLSSALRVGAALFSCAALVPARPEPPARLDPPCLMHPSPMQPAGQERPGESLTPADSIALERADGVPGAVLLAEFSVELGADPGLLGLGFEAFWRDAPESVDGDPAQRAQVGLVGGDRLAGRVTGGGAEELVLELTGGVALALSIDELERIVFPARLPDVAEAAPTPAAEGDRLYRRTGGVLDRLDGAVLGFSRGGVSFESLLGTRDVPWGDVAALFLETFGSPEGDAGSAALPVVVDLVDGSRLRGGLLGIDGEGCRLSRAGAQQLLLPLSAVAEVSFADGRFAFLSDLAPSDLDEGSPFGDDLGLSWPHRIDRAVDGGPLRVAGRSYLRGIGVHSPSRLTWELDGRWNSLRLAAALDDQVLRLDASGSVEFRVLLDDELAWTSGVRRGGDALVELPLLDLGEARSLTLEVDMASDFHMGDRANWLRPMLVRRDTGAKSEQAR